MRVLVRLEDRQLQLTANEIGLGVETRPLEDTDFEKFRTWAVEYDRFLKKLEYDQFLKKEDAREELLGLGGMIFEWLNKDGWLERVLRKSVGEATLIPEFQVTDIEEEGCREFLMVPWELMSRQSRHLAAEYSPVFCPVRRLGKPRELDSLSDECLGLVFMAASPRGQHVLDFEAEENAILNATAGMGFDLVVEESGNPELLGQQLAEARTMQVLHLSCHGRSEPEPVVMLEDEEGGGLLTDFHQLITHLRPNLPRLIFVSACRSARQGGFADPLAMDLVRGGIYGALGWDGSVFDHEATTFSRYLYRSLAKMGTLEEAAGTARLELFHEFEPRPSKHWHMARLWLGPKGGGSLVAGSRRRRVLGIDHGHKAFLDTRKSKSPVASREAFVARRRQIQTGLKVLREGSQAGLLITGMGRLGKSSLAARICHRRPDLTPVVIFGRYDALTMAEAIREACPAGQSIIDPLKANLPDHPEILGDILRAVLDGPCSQKSTDRQPILLVIDDLEQILEEPATGESTWRVKSKYVPVLRSVINAFRRANTASRLMITSRYMFTLSDRDIDLAGELFVLPLPPMDRAGARKQALRRQQMKLSINDVSEAADDAAMKKRQELFLSCIGEARGNPGLQDLLFDLVLQSPREAEKALDEMKVYYEDGMPPKQEDIQDFMENLVINKLMNIAGEEGISLLRALTLFELPIPFDTVSEIPEAAVGMLQKLLDLGLGDRFEDIVHPSRQAVAVNALVRPKLEALEESEIQNLVGHTLDPLFLQWRGSHPELWHPNVDLELTRLAMIDKNAVVLSACAPNALMWLNEQFEYRKMAQWGFQVINILTVEKVQPSINLLRLAGEACVMTGDSDTAQKFYDQALVSIDESTDRERISFEHGALLTAQGHLSIRRGELEKAVECFEKACRMEIERGNEKNAAVAMGRIADVMQSRGELEESLRIRREESLPVYERLGDVREKALTMGKIADILESQGEFEEALRIRREESLPVYERLGDVREKAVTMGKIADILQFQGEFEEALRIWCEEELPVYERLGDVRSKAVTMGKIANMLYTQGEIEEALALQQQRLETNRKLEDRGGIAATLWDLARIELDQGKHQEAAPKVNEAYQLFDRMGRLEGIAAIGDVHGQFLVAAGKLEEGLAVLRRSEAGFRKLGQGGPADQVAQLIDMIEAGLKDGAL